MKNGAFILLMVVVPLLAATEAAALDDEEDVDDASRTEVLDNSRDVAGAGVDVVGTKTEASVLVRRLLIGVSLAPAMLFRVPPLFAAAAVVVVTLDTDRDSADISGDASASQDAGLRVPLSLIPV
jgi:hypothetical protein